MYNAQRCNKEFTTRSISWIKVSVDNLIYEGRYQSYYQEAFVGNPKSLMGSSASKDSNFMLNGWLIRFHSALLEICLAVNFKSPQISFS